MSNSTPVLIDSQNEEWRDVPGYEGIYAASNLGRIKRLTSMTRAKAGDVLKPYLGNNGYWMIGLRHGKKRKKFTVHRLIMLTFVSIPFVNAEVNHINGDKLDNRLSNLEWVKHSDNIKHSYVLGRKISSAPGENNAWHKLTDKTVIEIRALAEKGVKHSEIARLFNVSQTCILSVVRRKTWKHI